MTVSPETLINGEVKDLELWNNYTPVTCYCAFPGNLPLPGLQTPQHILSSVEDEVSLVDFLREISWRRFSRPERTISASKQDRNRLMDTDNRLMAARGEGGLEG